MHVVSVPREAWVEKFASIPGIEPVWWDFTAAPPRPDIDYVALAWPIVAEPWPHLPELANLRWFQVCSAGYEYAEPHLPAGVGLSNGRGVHTSATCEIVMALVLAAQRALPSFVLSQARGRWEKVAGVPGLAERSVLIVGYGDIGQALAPRLTACEARVTGVRRQAHDPDGVADDVRSMAELPDIIGDFDIVVALTPLTSETHHLFDAALIGRMKPGALLVNAARGPVVDTEALLAALHAGHIRAALDVTDPEPLPDDHPLFFAPNVLISPHVGGLTQIIDARIEAFLADQLRRYGAGEPLRNVVIQPGR